MQDKTLRQTLSLLALGITAYLVLFTANVQAANGAMLEQFESLQGELEENVYGIPIYIESSDTNNTMRGDIYGVIPHPFHTVRQALTKAQTWCEVAPQHLNIKACTYRPLNDHCQLTFYTGRKYYEKADEVYQLPYRFQLTQSNTVYFQAQLTSDKGPMGTSNYRIELEAIPLENSSTFIHFSYSHQYNFFTRLGMEAYLATLGRHKVGFSVVDTDHNDEPVYVHGIRGIIERNAVRYYFAIQSYLDTAHIQLDERFTTKLQRWFDLTETHHRQLHELERNDYLEYKRIERQDQLRLQQAVFSSPAQDKDCPSPEEAEPAED